MAAGSAGARGRPQDQRRAPAQRAAHAGARGDVLIPLLAILAVTPAWSEPNSRELALFPFIARLGVMDARQYGLAGDFNFPLAPSFALTFRGQYDYAPLARDESEECPTVCRQEALARSPRGLLVKGGAYLGPSCRPNDFNPRDVAIARNLTRLADGHLLGVVQLHLGLTF